MQSSKDIKSVAVLFSGGKDSVYALEYALSRWKVSYLLSIKPTRTDCYLFHYATVEHTPKLAKLTGLKHILLKCNVAHPKREADIVRRVVEMNPVDAVILGGVGLQRLQLKSIQDALLPFGTEVFASHAGHDHEEVIKDMTKKGYRFIISQIASEGLNEYWLGKVIDERNINELIQRSRKFGFHVGGEGGYYDTLVLEAPILNKALRMKHAVKYMEGQNVGYIEADFEEVPLQREY